MNLPDTVMIKYKPGRTYSVTELAELARRAMEQKNITQQQAAEELSRQFEAKRGSRFQQPQVSAALGDPEKNPGMVMLLIEAFTDYRVNETTKYTLERKEQ